MDLRVSDVKQYQYCPRVVYYQYVMPVDKAVTYKMEKGKAAQEDLEELEQRRKLRAYGLSEGKRRFNWWVHSRDLGLSGKLDMAIETGDAIYPVDFKFTREPPRKNHVYQLAGYALILEDTERRPVTKGFIYLIPEKDAFVFDLTEEIKAECLNTLEQIRDMIRAERFPDPPSRRAKCVDCEYQNYCRDIW
ncbi:MAG: CRISPR-associated protein Cas4 [Deltaproteobacteria bacterium]|nr:CRISPR-associated protein Cas4 [Deltaproteobacteria bacterium]MBW2066895.1 CRISPR-associated protein Cas4 [Deltaproteobacteria bacterium]